MTDWPERLDGHENHDALNLLGMLINEASDVDCQEKSSLALEWCEQLSAREWNEEEEVRFHYFWANAWSVKRHASGKDSVDAAWAWNHYELGQELFHLRLAYKARGFDASENYQKCQICVNTANALNTLGRPIQALEFWNNALDIIPNYGMALGNHGYGLMWYARQLYDRGHGVVLMVTAFDDFISAISPGAYYETDGYESAKAGMEVEAKNIAAAIDLETVRPSIELNNFSLGKSKAERAYRRWCLQEVLFLNPLNDLGPYPIAARDILVLPPMRVSINEPPNLLGFFNQLKQEYASARYMFYEGITAEGVHFSDRDVTLINTLDYPAYSLAVERVKAAFRILYSIFDKIAYFINAYWCLGIPEYAVSFHSIWVTRSNNSEPTLRQQFDRYQNLPMRGLYWLSKDILGNDELVKTSIDPDAQALRDIRNHLEHKYFKAHDIIWDKERFSAEPFTHFKDTLAYSMRKDELEAKTLRLLKSVREGLMYLSLAVHQEEELRKGDDQDESNIMPIDLETWDDDWKR